MGTHSLFLANSVRRCREITQKSGSNFASAFHYLPDEKQESIEILYAFMRKTDDLSDGPANIANKRTRLTQWRSAVLSLFDAGGKEYSDDEYIELLQASEGGEVDILPAVDLIRRRHSIPSFALLDVIDGAISDLDEPVRMPLPTDTIHYCDAVAGAVGIAALCIFGTLKPVESPAIHSMALACGRALQWTNMLRDIGEDLEMNRFYFPLSEKEIQVPSPDFFDELRHRSQSDCSASWQKNECGLRDWFNLQFERTNQFYRESRPLFEQISPDAQRVYLLMRGVYYQLFQKIQKTPWLTLQTRIRLSIWDKIRILFFPTDNKYVK